MIDAFNEVLYENLLSAARDFKRVWEDDGTEYPDTEECDWEKYPDDGDRWSHDINKAREEMFAIIESLKDG